MNNITDIALKSYTRKENSPEGKEATSERSEDLVIELLSILLNDDVTFIDKTEIPNKLMMVNNFIDKVKDFIPDEETKQAVFPRLPYHIISKEIFGYKEDLSKIEAISSSLKYIISIEDNSVVNYHEKKISAKFLDHVELSRIQSLFINKQKEDIEKAQVDLSIYKSNFKKIRKNIKKTESKIFNQVLSIVSIFTGLAFIIFGGLSLFSDLTVFFKGVITRPWVGLIYLSTVGMIILALIYLFFNFVVYIIRDSSSSFQKIESNKDKKESRNENIFWKFHSFFHKNNKEKDVFFSIGNVMTTRIFKVLFFIFLLGIIMNSRIGNELSSRFQWFLMHNVLHWY